VACAAGLVIGVGGAVTATTPAAATFDQGPQVTVTGSAECDRETGNWTLTWTVTNENRFRDATAQVITQTGFPRSAVEFADGWEVLPDESVIVGLADGDTIAANSSVEATQTVPGDALAALLVVELRWTSRHSDTTERASNKVEFEGECVPDAPLPGAEFASNCEGVVFVTLTNGADATKDASFTVTAEGGFEESHTVAPGGDPVVVEVPAGQGAVSVTESGTEVGSYTWEDSVECHPAEIAYEATCDSLTFALTNPEAGAETTVVLTPNEGEAVTTTLAPGASDTATFAASEGLVVSVAVDGEEWGTAEWTEPEGCEEPPGEGGGLPVTGASTGIVAGIALLLVAFGGAMYLAARRRRIRFTA
jgi:hypothetical protein